MSFSFRNIFSPEDENGGGASGGTHDPVNDPPRAGQQGAFGDPPKSRGPRSQAFLVNEILPFIPPAIAAQSGIPMEQEVRIPLPSDGSTDVKLSTIFQACPKLFAAEITPLNDSTVTLPAKLGSVPQPPTGQSSRLTPGATFGRPGAPQNPGKAAPASANEKEESPEDNPFWSPDDNASPAGEQASAAPRPSPQDSSSMQNSSENPFGNKEPQPSRGRDERQQQSGGSLPQGFSAPSSGPSPAGKESNPFAKEEAPAPSQPPVPEENPFVSDEGFSSLFSRKAEEDSAIPFPGGGPSSPGSDQSDEPGSWGNLFSNAPSQTSQNGPDSAPSMGNMMSGSAKQGAAPAPQQAQPAKPAPSAPQYETMDDDEDYGDFLPPAADVPLPAIFDSPEYEYSTEAESEEEASEPVFGEDLNPFAEEAGQQTEEKPTPAPFQPTQAGPSSPAPNSTSGGANAFDSLAPLGGLPSGMATTQSSGSAGQPNPSSPVGNPASSAPQPAPPAQQQLAADAAPEKAEERKPKPMVEAGTPKPTVASETREEKRPTAPEPEPVMDERMADPPPAAASTPSPMGLPVVDDTGEIRDIELRAIFSTSEEFTMGKVARRVVTLPGITSCALATPGKLVQASRNEESRIGDEAREMVTTIRNLAKLTGMPEARCFTLHTDKGIVSIFLEGECCVTVHHESTSFGPGVREKLILIARSLEKLEE